MTTKLTIMVQISNHEWTREALHCACLLARNTSARIVLVQMIPVQHASWLGTGWGYLNLTDQDQADFADCKAMLEDYGVEFTSLVFQYVTPTEAIAQATEHVNANAVFAKIPKSVIPLLTAFQRWSLNRRFISQNRQWIQYPAYDPAASAVVIETALEINGLATHHIR